MSTLYKFIASLDAVKFVLDGVVKFTPIAELNDPSELVPDFDSEAVVASLRRLRSTGYTDEDMLHLRQQGKLLQTLAPRFHAIGVPNSKAEATRQIQAPVFDSTATLEHLLQETAVEMSSKVGLFCLTERFDSLPMWAHYAANAEGIAVEFNTLEQVFSGDDTGVLRQPTQVNYQRESYGVTFDPESHKSLFFSKFSDWSYEQEVRVVLPLSECRKVQGSQGTLHTYRIPKSCIARLILGWNMNSAHVDAAVEMVRTINPKVEVCRAIFNRGRVSHEPLVQTGT